MDFELLGLGGAIHDFRAKVRDKCMAKYNAIGDQYWKNFADNYSGPKSIWDYFYFDHESSEAVDYYSSQHQDQYNSPLTPYLNNNMINTPSVQYHPLSRNGF